MASYVPALPRYVFTYRYPKTRHWSGDQPSRSRRTAASCSWPCQCGPACPVVSPSYPARPRRNGMPYWTMSARIGALKTFGRVAVSLLAAPSAPMMVTVGRDIFAAGVSAERRWCLVGRRRSKSLFAVRLPQPNFANCRCGSWACGRSRLQLLASAS